MLVDAAGWCVKGLRSVPQADRAAELSYDGDKQLLLSTSRCVHIFSVPYPPV